MTTTILASFPSPSQGVWHLGPIPIRAYALFILAGVIVALFIGDRRWTERGGERGVVYDIALWAIIFGLIGGRLYHVLTDWTTYFGPGGAGLLAAFKIQEGGLGIWGAVALGGIGAWIGCRRRDIPLPAFADAIAPGIILAQAIGRIGNYFNQELYGRSTNLPWGLQIFERRDANGVLDSLNGVSTGQQIDVVHPTFLYELLWNLLVFVLLIWVDRRFRIGHGRLFALYVAAYCFGRFWIELMRSDMATHIAGIRINSFVSVFVFIGAVVYIMVAPKGREDPAALRGDAKPQDADESLAEAVTKELTAVAATTGVVAAATAAGEKENEDAAAETEAIEKPEAEAVAEAEAFAEAGEEADEAEEADESEAVAEEEAAEPEEAETQAEPAGDDEPEQAEAVDTETSDEEDAESASEDEAEAVGGVGAVEGDEVAEAEEAAPEVHEAAVESAEEAAAAADEIADEDAAEPEESETEAEAAGDDTEAAGDDEPEQAEAVDTETSREGDAEAVGGVGAVEGDEVAEAEEAAPEVHEAAAENADEAAAIADEVAEEDSDEPDAGEPAPEGSGEELAEQGEAEDQGEAVGGVGAVEGNEVSEAEMAVPEAHEAAVENAEDAATAAHDVAGEPAADAPQSPVGDKPELTPTAEEPAQTAEEPEQKPEQKEVSGDRLRGWLRARRKR